MLFIGLSIKKSSFMRMKLSLICFESQMILSLLRTFLYGVSRLSLTGICIMFLVRFGLSHTIKTLLCDRLEMLLSEYFSSTQLSKAHFSLEKSLYTYTMSIVC